MPDEVTNFGSLLVLDFRKNLWYHVQAKYGAINI